MASGVVSFMGVTVTLNAYPTYIIAYLSLIHCLSPVNRLKQAETYLWKGNIKNAIALFRELKKKPAANFCKYLEKHKETIINYEVFQRDGICSIGSGAV